jgi:MoxR-like ATPase
MSLSLGGYPSAERERAILDAKVPGAGARLSAQVVAFAQALRGMELYKPPGIAETLDWAQALMALDATELAAPVVDSTLGVLLKYQDDIAKVRGETVAECWRRRQRRSRPCWRRP